MLRELYLEHLLVEHARRMEWVSREAWKLQATPRADAPRRARLPRRHVEN